MNDDETWGAQLYRGSLELCMLALLTKDERYGYEIAQALAQTGGLVVGEGTIYPLLSRLQRQGLIEARWRESPAGPPRKYYRLTANGQTALATMSARWASFSAEVNRIVQEAHDGRA